jgi:ankyrin repeat protein
MNIVQAIAVGDRDVAQELLGESKQDEIDSDLPLQSAITLNDLDTVQQLVCSSNVNRQNGKMQTPLHAAVVSGNKEAFMLLVGRGDRDLEVRISVRCASMETCSSSTSFLNIHKMREQITTDRPPSILPADTVIIKLS